jgi:hypothetical protein
MHRRSDGTTPILRVTFLLGYLAIMMMAPAHAADVAYNCKADRRVVATCQWIVGSLNMSVRGVFYLSPRDDENKDFVVDDETIDREVVGTKRIFDIAPVPMFGEFEFCRFSDRPRPENRSSAPPGTMEAWGCLNATRNVEIVDDGKRYCELMRGFPVEYCKTK